MVKVFSDFEIRKEILENRGDIEIERRDIEKIFRI